MMGAFASFFSSCDLEIPQRIQVNSSFGLHVPVGDIGDLQEVKDILEYANGDKISSLFGDGEVSVCLYTKEGYGIPLPDTTDPNKNAGGTLGSGNAINPGEVRSMFLRFPLARMDLDFTSYFKNDVTIPDITMPDISNNSLIPSPEGTPLPFPYSFELPPIPLGAMSQWIESIKLNNTTGNVKLTTVTVKNGGNLSDTLQMAIPAFGIGGSSPAYQLGTTDGPDLVFTANTETTLNPQNDSTVNIYLRLMKVPPSGASYSVEVNLAWTEAEVNPNSGGTGTHGDTITLPTGQFTEFSTDYHFASLPCYLYVGGPFSPANKVTLGLEADGAWLVGQSDTEGKEITESRSFATLYEDPFPKNDGYYDGDLYDPTASFNLAAQVNTSTADIELKYWMKLDNSWTVTPDGTASTISADMVVILPLQFDVVKQEKQIGNDFYVDIMTMEEYGSSGSGDLFGRDQLGVTANFLTGIRLSGKNVKNTFFSSDLFLHVEDNVDREPVPIKSGKDFDIEITGAPYIPTPFHPSFFVCVKKPAGGGSATIKIAPQPKEGDDVFAVRLSADVTGMAEYEYDL
jgi:hypothetical protein